MRSGPLLGWCGSLDGVKEADSPHLLADGGHSTSSRSWCGFDVNRLSSLPFGGSSGLVFSAVVTNIYVKGVARETLSDTELRVSLCHKL